MLVGDSIGRDREIKSLLPEHFHDFMTTFAANLGKVCAKEKYG